MPSVFGTTAIAVCAIIALGSVSPTAVDRIVERHVAARGGMAAIRAIQTLRMEGIVQPRADMELTLRAEKKRPNKARVEFGPPGGQIGVGGFDGKTAWEANPFDDLPDPRLLDGAQKAGWERAADFDGFLIDWKKKGYRLVLIESSRKAHVLRLTFPNGRSSDLFLNAETYLLERAEMTRSVHFNPPSRVTTLYRDYRRVNGVLFPFETEESDPNGHRETIRWKKIEANVPLDDARFAAPAPASVR